MDEIIRIDVSDHAIREVRELLRYRLIEFIQENMTDKDELMSLLESGDV